MNPYAQLAKSAVESFVLSGEKSPAPKNLPDEFYEKKYGVFVTLRDRSGLRGCIGTYKPCQKNLAEEIVENAIAACSKDSRFDPVAESELPGLSYEISLLDEPEKISKLSELDPKKYGVMVRCPDGRCGLLLPDIDGVDTVDDQLAIAANKAGISPSFEENIEIYKFNVKKHSQDG